MGRSSLLLHLLLLASAEVAAGVERSPRIKIMLDLGCEDSDTLTWLTNRTWAWGLSADPVTTVEDLKKVRSLGLMPVATYLDASPQTRARHAHDKNWTGDPAFTPKAVFAKQIAAAGGNASDVVWMAFTEEDSSGYGFAHVLMNATQPSLSRHEDAQRLFDAYIHEAMASPDGAAPWQGAGVVVLGRSGFASTAHTMGRHGVDWLMTERANDDVGDLQPAIAFTRGAARQFAMPAKKPWGIDLSMWWGAVQGWCADQPANFYRRHLYHSLLAGASLFEVEGASSLLDAATGQPTPLAQELDAFGSFAMGFFGDDGDGDGDDEGRRGGGRGGGRHRRGEVEGEEGDSWETDAPVALLLPSEGGWTDGPAYWAPTAAATGSWNFARLSRRRPGDRGVDGVLAMAFPGADLAAQAWPWGKCE